MATKRASSSISLSSSTSTTSQHNGQNPTAIVKGAGPSGLAAAISLAQAGFVVQVIERRPPRSAGEGRKNMVAVRPEALRQLENLVALKSVIDSTTSHGTVGCMTRITEGTTKNEMDGSIFSWPLTRYPPAEPAGVQGDTDRKRYAIPGKIDEQVPSSFVSLGDLEDCLARAALDHGVKITYNATISLLLHDGSHNYSALLVRNLMTDPGNTTNLGSPDLIVCASGKNDLDLQSELGFDRRTGVVLTESNLPSPNNSSNPLALQFTDDADRELESQLYSIFGIKTPTQPMGVLDHLIRKHDQEGNAQPVVEIQMNHASTSHFILQHPRSALRLSSHSSALELYILSRINAHLSTSYTSIQRLRDSGLLTWGDPLKPIVVETSTAPQYVFSNNVVLIGDAAVSCSPSSGLGADIGMTVDSQSIRVLADGLIDAKGQNKEIRKALADFNVRKAESAIIWSQGSRMFYMTSHEAEVVAVKE